MQIDFANLKIQHKLYKEEIEEAILKVARDCNFIMGSQIDELERNLEKFTGAKYAISCSSGTDALLLAMMALDIKPGDEVITTPFTFIATAETIAFLGATPVFVDIDEKTYNIDPNKIEEKITSKTKAIIPVSIYGQPADIDKISEIGYECAATALGEEKSLHIVRRCHRHYQLEEKVRQRINKLKKTTL